MGVKQGSNKNKAKDIVNESLKAGVDEANKGAMKKYFWQDSTNRRLLRGVQANISGKESSAFQDRVTNSGNSSDIYTIRTTKHKTISYETYCRQKRVL